jgi:large subunit ribosomal protein L25
MGQEELIEIPGWKRSKSGKGHARKLRKLGKIPANILNKSQSELIEIDPKWLSKAWKSGKKFSLDLEGSKRTVVIKELQIDPVKRMALHVDLMYE